MDFNDQVAAVDDPFGTTDPLASTCQVAAGDDPTGTTEPLAASGSRGAPDPPSPVVLDPAVDAPAQPSNAALRRLAKAKRAERELRHMRAACTHPHCAVLPGTPLQKQMRIFCLLLTAGQLLLLHPRLVQRTKA